MQDQYKDQRLCEELTLKGTIETHATPTRFSVPCIDLEIDHTQNMIQVSNQLGNINTVYFVLEYEEEI